MLVANSHNFFEIRNNTFVHSYINITVTPGGGVTRLRCYGDVEPIDAMNRLEFNLASSKLGAEILQQPADIVRGEFPNLILNRKESNQDGWISPRRRIASPGGSEYTIIKLAGESAIDRFIVDTVHFVGNAPQSICLEGCHIAEQGGTAVTLRRLRNAYWRNLISADQRDNAIFPNTCNVLGCTYNGPITHIRYRPIPDGGVQQIIVKGYIFDSKPEVPQKLPQQPKASLGPHKKRKRNDENQDAQEECRRKSSRTKKPVLRFQ
ncbi:galactose-binding domain-like protein [Parasitella parasitica]|nr:galactose-binding domain-like protein [Parasitella parasitica]